MSRKKEDLLPVTNSQYIKHSMTAWNLPSLDLNDPTEVEKRVMMYFTQCEADDLKPCVSGLANYLGVHRSLLWKWAKEERRADEPMYKQIILKAYGMIEQNIEEAMMNNKINAVAGIFLLKNHYNYDADQKLMISTMSEDEPRFNAKELEERYGKVIDVTANDKAEEDD